MFDVPIGKFSSIALFAEYPCELGALFDHLVGQSEQRRWNREAQRLGRLEIDH